MMEKQRIKLGARVLSDEELKMILPDADSVLEQIEMFRRNIPDRKGKEEKKKNEEESEQKTNNIGIMGCRGAGKTSVLKTFKERLREKNEERSNKPGGSRDILLPLIVPENMSSGITLMDVVLGMLKSEVEEITRETEPKGGDCIYLGRNPLEKEYNELVKQYCYIKKDYRDILIRQFTTEQNYVDKTKKIFNSDTEFIMLFRQFVEHLLKEGDALLFLFIDDIDLSTTRCMDVVKTLLSYLSIPRIVTFISGDMNTFKEALTLDFLRQENALNAGVFGKAFISADDEDSETLLKNKKELTYEYLKKIIPPAYRKEIKYWSLEERGAYRITEGREQNQKNLAELLAEAAKNKIGKYYFSYEEKGETKYMGPVFHMLDNTSRGLNNVYNVLQELYEQSEAELPSAQSNESLQVSEGLGSMSGRWRLLETLVDSKILYSNYRAQLLQKIIIREQGQVRIDFESAEHFLYHLGEGEQRSGWEEKAKSAEKAESNHGSTEKTAENKAEREKAEAVKRFMLFVLIDFAFQLFGAEETQGEEYTNLKNKIIGEYIACEEIEGKIAKPRELIKLHNKMPESVITDQRFSAARIVLYNLLYFGDFIFDLYLIKYLGRDEIYRILDKKHDVKNDADQADLYKAAYALTRVLDVICGSAEKRREYLADLYDRTPKAMLLLFYNLSFDPWMIYAERLVPFANIYGCKQHFNQNNSIDQQYSWNMAEKCFDNIDGFIHEAKSGGTLQDYIYAERENRELLYWLLYEELKEQRGDIFDLGKMSLKLVYEGIKKATIRRLRGTVISDRYAIKSLEERNYQFEPDGSAEGDSQKIKEYRAMMLIDKSQLWQDEYAKTKVGRYLENKIREFEIKIAKDMLIFDGSELVRESYQQLKDCEKGKSGGALINSLLDRINRLMGCEFESLKDDARQQGMEPYYMLLNHVLALQCLVEDFLNRHYRIRFGKKEARQFLAQLKELPLVIFPEGPQAEIIGRMRTDIGKGLFEIDFEFRDKVSRRFGSDSNLDKVVNAVYVEYYENGNKDHRIMRAVIKTIVNNDPFANGRPVDAATCYYIMYLAQKLQIEKLKQKYFPDNIQNKRPLDGTEPSFSKQEYDFMFHSYLRYLLANESDAARAGTEADAVAALAADLLAGEGTADIRMIQNIYEKVGKQLDLTEDEFGELFVLKAENGRMNGD